jgi:MurNAc alpha-1-phosphate uridylyltransferase
MIQAMILAAGEGRRMRPLTLTTPKPLLPVAGKALIEHQLERLAAVGVERCVINIAYLGEQIRQALGDGSHYGISITYSAEPYPLETGGAIHRALPLLDNEPFLLINADIWLDYPLPKLLERSERIADGHLILVPNPAHNTKGDFELDPEGRVTLAGRESAAPTYTFSGLSLLHPRIIRDYPESREIFPLLEALTFSVGRGGLTGEIYSGTWSDIGTPERLKALDAELRGRV